MSSIIIKTEDCDLG